MALNISKTYFSRQLMSLQLSPTQSVRSPSFKGKAVQEISFFGRAFHCVTDQ